jgi:hypothetical protein
MRAARGTLPALPHPLQGERVGVRGSLRGSIGFVLPKCADPGGGGHGGPRVAAAGRSSPDRSGRARRSPQGEGGFVLPKSAQPRRGGDGGPRVAAARPGRQRAIQCIEGLDRRLAPRQRAPLVAVEPHQARRDVILAEPRGHDLGADAAHAQHVDLRLGDADGGGMACLARALPGDPLRQRRHLGSEHRVGEHRQAQAVAQRIACHDRLAGARARPGAARRVGAVGGEQSFAGAWAGRRTVAHPGQRACHCHATSSTPSCLASI